MPARHYTIRIEVDVDDETDMEHFMPGSVILSSPDFGMTPVAGSDAEAIRCVFHFGMNYDRLKMSRAQVWEVARRAIEEKGEGDADTTRAP
jgi:hypothetical protein